MGTIKKGILGGFSGKVGTVVGASWKGIDYIRSLPTTVRNPRTPGQVNQRGKFATVIGFLSRISPMINVGYKNYAVNQTPVNAAMSYNLKNAVTGDAGIYDMDYAKVMVSKGTLCNPISHQIQVIEGEVSIGWDAECIGNALSSDMANVLVYNTIKNEAMILINAATRAEVYVGAVYQEHWKGDQVEVYLSFTSEDGKLVSDSMYLGQHDIPVI